MIKILVVEDDKASRIYFQKVLSKYGQCEIISDGTQFFEKVMSAKGSRLNYDLFFVDIMLPRYNGIQILKALRDIEYKMGVKKEDRAKVIMVSALSDRQSINECFDYGCDEYIIKPFEIKDITNVLKKFKISKVE
jgi:two-component system, chemotaxis family, chemotaxis protein CheY